GKGRAMEHRCDEEGRNAHPGRLRAATIDGRAALVLSKSALRAKLQSSASHGPMRLDKVMSTDLGTVSPSAIVYPDSDGKPMADNTWQFQWIVTIKDGLEALYRDEPNVFVAGDLLWYPVEGNPKI